MSSYISDGGVLGIALLFVYILEGYAGDGTICFLGWWGIGGAVTLHMFQPMR